MLICLSNVEYIERNRANIIIKHNKNKCKQSPLINNYS